MTLHTPSQMDRFDTTPSKATTGLVFLFLFPLVALTSLADEETPIAKTKKSVTFMANEAALLSKLNEFHYIVSFDFKRENIQAAKQLKEIQSKLQSMYQKATAAQVCERMYSVISGNFDGAVMVGAAIYLANLPGDEPIPYLKEGLKVEIPGGVSTHCGLGLAERCRGDEIEKMVAMLESTDKAESDYAFWIIHYITMAHHRSQFDELKRIHAEMKPGKWREAIGAFVFSMGRSTLDDG